MGPSLSVIIPTRARPRHLARALAALRLQSPPRFEVVLVGDRPDAVSCGAPSDMAATIRYRQCPEANVSRARNIGAAAASGAVLAFMDDDAAPEPGWLEHLTAPFADPAIDLVAGRVRGWNGLSDEAAFAMVDGALQVEPLAPDGLDAPPPDAADPRGWLLAPERPGAALHVLGASHAVRADALARIGGYNEAYRYFLEETDLSLRLAAAGGRAAFAPRAQVQHMRAASALRRGDRTPLSLYEIGASMAHFLVRHAPDRMTEALDRFRAAQRAGLGAALQIGRLEPRRLPALMEELEDGFVAGVMRRAHLPLTACAPRRRAEAPRAGPWLATCEGAATPLRLRAIATAQDPAAAPLGLALHGPARDLPRLSDLAETMAAQGWAVTILDLRWGLRPLRLRLCDNGVWLHTGGLHGVAERDRPRMTLPRGARLVHELRRVAHRRPADWAVIPAADAAGMARAVEIPPELRVHLARAGLDAGRNYVIARMPPPVHAATHPNPEAAAAERHDPASGLAGRLTAHGARLRRLVGE
ncbi:MAG: GT2 family glycosyltransferase [Paracoccaceae bacterium]